MEFEEANGLRLTYLRSPIGLSFKVDIDGCSVFMRKFAVKGVMSAVLQWVAGHATLSKRSVLYEEGEKFQRHSAWCFEQKRGLAQHDRLEGAEQ